MKPAEAKKRRDGSGMMDFERQQKYRDKPKVAAQAVKDAEKNGKKKEKDRLRYLLKKGAKQSLSKAEEMEKKIIQNKK